MAEKNVKARIIHKHDTEVNWNKATGFIPNKGEIIVYDIDETYSYERFKIGDGTKNVVALPFFAAGALTSEGLEQVKGVKVDNATNADNATEATHATNADNATNATSADSAKKTIGTFTVNGVAFDGSEDKTVTISVEGGITEEDIINLELITTADIDEICSSSIVAASEVTF